MGVQLLMDVVGQVEATAIRGAGLAGVVLAGTPGLVADRQGSTAGS